MTCGQGDSGSYLFKKCLFCRLFGYWLLNNWFLKAGFHCIDNGTDRNGKIFKLSACELSQEQKNALMGLYAFGGNDFVPCRFLKGKQLY